MTATQTTTTPTPLTFGDVLPNGATVVDYRHLWDRELGAYAGGIVLARLKRYPYGSHQWATWVACWQDDRDEPGWATTSGRYYFDLSDAAAEFETRT